MSTTETMPAGARGDWEQCKPARSSDGDLLLRRMLRPVPRAVPQARQAVADALNAAGFPEWPATLLVSELAANAVDHAHTEFEICVVLAGRVRIEVRDASPAMPSVQPVDPDRERGRGLHLVSRVAADWGVHAARRGKTVWFELDPSATA